jgi:hypothetical protein
VERRVASGTGGRVPGGVGGGHVAGSLGCVFHLSILSHRRKTSCPSTWYWTSTVRSWTRTTRTPRRGLGRWPGSVVRYRGRDPPPGRQELGSAGGGVLGRRGRNREGARVARRGLGRALGVPPPPARGRRVDPHPLRGRLRGSVRHQRQAPGTRAPHGPAGSGGQGFLRRRLGRRPEGKAGPRHLRGSPAPHRCHVRGGGSPSGNVRTIAVLTGGACSDGELREVGAVAVLRDCTELRLRLPTVARRVPRRRRVGENSPTPRALARGVARRLDLYYNPLS